MPSKDSSRHSPGGKPNTKSGKNKKPNTKRTGEIAEAAFVFKAVSLGFAVAKPWGDSERYDIILDAGHRTWRVQVKCTATLSASAYEVQATYCDGNHKGHYTPDDIDFLVAYIIPLNLWYIVPSHAFPPSASLRFYPYGNVSGRPVRFEHYRDAWHLFRLHDLSGVTPVADEELACDHETTCKEKGPDSDISAVPLDPDVPSSPCPPERAGLASEGSAVPKPTPAPQSGFQRRLSQSFNHVRSLYKKND